MTDTDAQAILDRFEETFETFATAPSFAKSNHLAKLLDLAMRALRQEGGPNSLYQLAPRLEEAGLFTGTDWEDPSALQTTWVSNTLGSKNNHLVALELLNQLRMIAIAQGMLFHPGFSPAQASHYVKEVLALNLSYLFEKETEATRGGGMRARAISRTLQYIAEQIGTESFLEKLAEEIWRLLRQRPIKVDRVKAMITQLALYAYDPEQKVNSTIGVDSLITGLFGPTPGCRDDPGAEAYSSRLREMDSSHLQNEATAFARAMHDTGLVSDYHSVFLRFVVGSAPELIPQALGLSSTGIDCYLTFRSLILALIEGAVFHETSQCVYGLTCMLERGVLYDPAVAPSLWRQINLKLRDESNEALRAAFGGNLEPRIHLLAGTISVLGQPLGIGQGDNPTCQSARALSFWAYSDPSYLLQILTWAARDGDLTMHFEGKRISSRHLPPGGAQFVKIDLDPVSLILVPHLDRIYAEMGRLALVPGQDPHNRVNPEFHGWRVGRGFAIAVDVATGQLKDYDRFVRDFYSCYHFAYNQGTPVIYPQPVGIAITDSQGHFVGWHAITLLRVSLDHKGVVRVYFYNPNNDSGQDWGKGVVVSTEGNGEYHGESSLPFDQFASRLYLFHYDVLEQGDVDRVPPEEVERVTQSAIASWAMNRTGGSSATVPDNPPIRL